MTLNRFIYKTHKWLAVGVGLFTLIWFASGVVMVMPKNFLGKGSVADGSAVARTGPGYKEIRLSIPQAIAAAEAAAGKPAEVTGVSLRRVNGRLAYEINTAKSGTHLIDALDGTPIQVTQEFARQMAEQALGGRAKAREISLLQNYTMDYMYGELPAYRVAMDDEAATQVYIGKTTGAIRWSDWKGRLRAFISGSHSFDFLLPIMANKWIRVALAFLSFVGVCMTMFGTWILWLQFQNWRARRAGKAIEA
jgi:hypothetical protein